MGPDTAAGLHTRAVILENQEVGPSSFRMRLLDPKVATAALPGQFVHVRVAPGSFDPLLRRPFSVAWADRSAGAFVILYRVVGRGTKLLAERRPGEELDMVGPLGRGFDVPPGGGDVALVAGGLGVAPILLLAGSLLRARRRFTLFAGARSRDLLVGLDLLPRAGPDGRAGTCVADPGYRVLIATEDGSLGERGTVTDVLQGALDAGDFACVYACGPIGMLRNVARLAEASGARLQVSLEERMACGLGACLGCAVRKRPTRGKPGSHRGYLRVCADGPVFWWDEVDPEDRGES